MPAGPSPGRTAWMRSGAVETGGVTSSASASKRMTRRLPSRVTACGVAGWASSVRRTPAGAAASILPVIRGTRRSPRMMSREGLRTSIFAARAGARARETKSTGTSQLRPSRAGAAGREISRPETEARGWPALRTIVWVRVATVSPPAAVSSRTVRSKSRVRSSSANISCSAEYVHGERLPALARQDGVRRRRLGRLGAERAGDGGCEDCGAASVAAAEAERTFKAYIITGGPDCAIAGLSCNTRRALFVSLCELKYRIAMYQLKKVDSPPG